MRWGWALASALALFGGCKGEPVDPFHGGTDSDSDTDSDTDADAGDPAEDCDPSAAGWSEEWAELEAQIVEIVNDVRTDGADCGDAGVFDAAEPLVMEPHLQCAARVHSLWMGDNNQFSHDSPGGPLGDNEYERVQNAGYEGIALGENIAAIASEPEEVVDMWVGAGTQCAKLMNPAATETGVGYALVSSSTNDHFWTQEFGTQ